MSLQTEACPGFFFHSIFRGADIFSSGANKFDQTERHDFWLRLWLFFSVFLFPPEKRGMKKGQWICKVVIKSHAFQPGQEFWPSKKNFSPSDINIRGAIEYLFITEERLVLASAPYAPHEIFFTRGILRGA